MFPSFMVVVLKTLRFEEQIMALWKVERSL